MEEPKQTKKVTRYHLVRHKWPDEIKEERARRRKNLLITCVCIVCFLLGFMTNNLFRSPAQMASNDFHKLEQIYAIMENEWYFGKEEEELSKTLLNNAINGLLSNPYDPHTMYMEPEEYQNFATSLQGNFVGIGIQYYALDDHTFLVERVIKGSGAEAGGMMKGDILQAVDDISISDKDIDEVSAMIRGKEGSKVKITVLRENETLDLTITRSVVNDSVFGYEQGDIGILEINTFAETSGDEVGKHLAQFKASGKRFLLIDLRDNGGGYVTAAMQIASYLIPQKAVVYQEQSKSGTIKQQRAYSEYERYEFEKIAILINEDTASASEVLTSCLKAHLDHVTTIGVKSYGKGTVQLPITFSDGSSFKYTIAEWLTPAGEHINGVGITPDITVALDPAVTTGILSIPEGESYGADSVSVYAKPVQIYLKFLGYAANRVDEYFSPVSSAALKQYQQEHDLNANGEINEETIKSLLSSCSLKWRQEQERLDLQMNKALEVLK